MESARLVSFAWCEVRGLRKCGGVEKVPKGYATMMLRAGGFGVTGEVATGGGSLFAKGSRIEVVVVIVMVVSRF
jgi:hypothetical protein